jgi:hypothetical protein
VGCFGLEYLWRTVDDVEPGHVVEGKDIKGIEEHLLFTLALGRLASIND